jgi:hypothetical protein
MVPKVKLPVGIDNTGILTRNTETIDDLITTVDIVLLGDTTVNGNIDGFDDAATNDVVLI